MRIGARGKLFLVAPALLVVSLITAEIYLLPSVEHDLTERIRQALYVRLHLVAERAATYARPTDSSVDWDLLADRLGKIAQARVTFIQEDGQVIGDSEVLAENLGTLENHRARPEVAAAFNGQTTDNIRYSATMQNRMLYAATKVPGNSKMVARVSLPLAWVDQAKSKTRTLLLGGALVALLAGVLMSSAAAVILSRSLRRLTAVARRMASGELEARSHLESADEIGELGRTLDHLAANLS
jgi:two-component system phosphate regulon sensor histidine kinase PhoR